VKIATNAITIPVTAIASGDQNPLLLVVVGTYVGVIPPVPVPVPVPEEVATGEAVGVGVCTRDITCEGVTVNPVEAESLPLPAAVMV